MQLKLQQQKLKEMSVVGLLKEHSLLYMYCINHSMSFSSKACKVATVSSSKKIM